MVTSCNCSDIFRPSSTRQCLHTQRQVRRTLAPAELKVIHPASSRFLWNLPTGAPCCGGTHVPVHITAEGSGSPFNKLQVNDIFRDEKCPCHGLHGNPFRVWLHLKLHEDLERQGRQVLDEERGTERETNQVLIMCYGHCCDSQTESLD